MKALTVIQIGHGERLEKVISQALADVAHDVVCQPGRMDCFQNCRILFAVYVDKFGPDEQFAGVLRTIRSSPNCLRGSIGGIVVDGEEELYTKEIAQSLALAANMAGCIFPGKPLVEGTGSLYNQHILANRSGCSWEETYLQRVRELALNICSFNPPKMKQPRILVIHASDNQKSNTVWMGREVLKRLPNSFEKREISLQNGTIYDCRGCSYEACMHFAENDRCFYGGTITQDVFPAIRDADVMLFLCPNYNDAVSANIMALFNRLTNFLLLRNLSDKYVYGIVVSGYSGSDLVARQLLGAMSLNKTAILPPKFCIMQTAHDPGSAEHSEGIQEMLDAFAKRIIEQVQNKNEE